MADCVRPRLSIPKDDTEVLGWMDRQANLALSMRLLIKWYIAQHGVTDPMTDGTLKDMFRGKHQEAKRPPGRPLGSRNKPKASVPSGAGYQDVPAVPAPAQDAFAEAGTAGPAEQPQGYPVQALRQAAPSSTAGGYKLPDFGGVPAPSMQGSAPAAGVGSLNIDELI